MKICQLMVIGVLGMAACDSGMPSQPATTRITLRNGVVPSGTRLQVASVFHWSGVAPDTRFVVTSFTPFELPLTACVHVPFVGELSGIFRSDAILAQIWTTQELPRGTKLRLVEFHYNCSIGGLFTAEVI